MKKSIYIRDIKGGEKICDFFFVTEKNLAYSQKGSPYLNLRLKDKTGELDGKVWDNALDMEKVFRKGDFIFIQSRAVQYKNAVQLSVMSARKAEEQEVRTEDYFPVAKENPDKMFSELMTYIEAVETPPLQALLQSFFQDEEIVGLFKRAPAAKGFHHVYIGGLLEHTLSVVRILSWLAGHYGGLNRDLLMTGGILHDIGKIYEYSYDGIVDYTDEGRLVGHIVMSVEMLDRRISALSDFPGQLAMELRHILLSHHGTLEFGSPKRPKTMEALVVHFADDLDAKINAMQLTIEGAVDSESDWTPYHRLLERYIYKGK